MVKSACITICQANSKRVIMEKQFLDWVRQANGLLWEAYCLQAQECRLCWENGELHFQALITTSWQVIKTVPVDGNQYLHFFRLATQMIDDGGFFQLQVPGASSSARVSYQIKFQSGNDAAQCAVQLILQRADNNRIRETGGGREKPPAWAENDLLDSDYIN
jgi:hypothetical protein